jgi:hypothetical protein
MKISTAMASGGEIDRIALVESFSRIKDDISNLKSELDLLKKENKKILEENQELKKRIISNKDAPMGKETISDIVAETVKNLQLTKKSSNDPFLKKINKKKKVYITNRIQLIAEQKSHSLPDLKELIVDQEGLCSKATFYRYIERMKKKQIIDFIKIEDEEVIVKI